MHGGSYEDARENKVIRQIEGYVAESERRDPSLGNEQSSARGQKVSAKQQRCADQQNGGQVQAAGRNQGAEATEHEQIQRNFKVALHRCGQWSDLGLQPGRRGHERFYCWRFRREREEYVRDAKIK